MSYLRREPDTLISRPLSRLGQVEIVQRRVLDQLCREMWEQGKTYRQLGAALNVSDRTAYRWLHEGVGLNLYNLIKIANYLGIEEITLCLDTNDEGK